MGDAFPSDAAAGSPSGTSSSRHLAEEGAALAHDHRHQVDGDRVEQPELEALPGDGAGRHRDGVVAGDDLCLRDRGLHAVGDEVERSTG